MSRKKYILCTASMAEKGGKEIAGELLQIDVVPFIAIEYADGSELTERIARLAAQPVHVVFTSANGVEAVVRQLAIMPNGWRVYCLSGKTRSAAMQYFRADAVLPGCADSAQLAGKILTDGVARIVFFCGGQRLDILPSTLREAGVEVEECAVYHTKETPQRLSQQYDAVLFFSPSGVRSFFSTNGAGAATLFAIGETTAAEVRKHSGNLLIVLQNASKAQMLEDAKEYLLSC